MIPALLRLTAAMRLLLPQPGANAAHAMTLTLLLLAASPALAQSIDLSPIQNLLQGIVDAITGPLGIVIGTLALIGVFLSWLFGILDFRQAMWVLVGIAGVAAAPTIVSAIWAGGN
jgi:type IV secretion system protein VirB2